MKITTIPAGYRLTVNSWENDGDHRRSVTRDGLSKEEVLFLTDVCEGMKMSNKPSFGNLYEPSDDECAEFEAFLDSLIKKHGLIDVTAEDVIDSLYDLGLSSGDYYTRMCENYKVEHVPKEVVLYDVTENF